VSILKISIRQIKAARSLLDWSQERLAEASGVSLPTIRRLEAADGLLGGREDTGEKILAALKAAGVEFTNGDQPGVRIKSYRLKDAGQNAFPPDDPRFIGFGAVEGERKITVLVEDLALQHIEPKISGGADHMWAFEKHRSRIFRIAAQKYDLGLIEAGQTISVMYADIADR
jgi:transcriptional regulator with XRE-family HTH domain